MPHLSVAALAFLAGFFSGISSHTIFPIVRPRRACTAPEACNGALSTAVRAFTDFTPSIISLWYYVLRHQKIPKIYIWRINNDNVLQTNGRCTLGRPFQVAVILSQVFLSSPVQWPSGRFVRHTCICMSERRNADVHSSGKYDLA